MVWNLLFLFLNKKFKNLRKKYLKYFLIFLHSYRYRFSRMSLKTGSKGEKNLNDDHSKKNKISFMVRTFW